MGAVVKNTIDKQCQTKNTKNTNKTSKIIVTGLVSSLLVLTTLALPGQSQQKAAAKDKTNKTNKTNKTVGTAVKKTGAGETAAPKSGMAGAGKWVPADLSFEGHDCTLQLPGDSSLSEFVTQGSKMFSFKGPAHPDKKASVFNVTISPGGKADSLPGERALMDTMLNPQRSNLKPYKEEKLPIINNDGHAFKGMSFSGQAQDGEMRHGFVYLSQDKDTFFVLFAQDEEPFSEKSLPLLMKSAQSCHVKNAAPSAAAPAQTKKP